MEAAVSEESSEKGNQRQRGGRGQTSDESQRLNVSSLTNRMKHDPKKGKMRRELSRDSNLKTLLISSVSLDDLFCPPLRPLIDDSYQHHIHFSDCFKQHNVDGVLELVFHTVSAADSATEQLHDWREGILVHRIGAHDTVEEALRDLRLNDRSDEGQCMLFVKNFPNCTTEEELRDLFPGHVSLTLARDDDGKQLDYAYVLYPSQQEALAAEERHAFMKFGDSSLYVMHFGKHTRQFSVDQRTSMGDDKRMKMLRLCLSIERRRQRVTGAHSDWKPVRLQRMETELAQDAVMRAREGKRPLTADMVPPPVPGRR